jgi:hypothetical protein
MYVGRSFVRGLQIIGDCLLLVDSDIFGVSANIPLVEDAAWEQIELFILQGAKQASPDLCDCGDFVE